MACMHLVVSATYVHARVALPSPSPLPKSSTKGAVPAHPPSKPPSSRKIPAESTAKAPTGSAQKGAKSHWQNAAVKQKAVQDFSVAKKTNKTATSKDGKESEASPVPNKSTTPMTGASTVSGGAGGVVGGAVAGTGTAVVSGSHAIKESPQVTSAKKEDPEVANKAQEKEATAKPETPHEPSSKDNQMGDPQGANQPMSYGGPAYPQSGMFGALQGADMTGLAGLALAPEVLGIGGKSGEGGEGE